MDRLNQINPFTKRDSYSNRTVITYKVLTFLSWALSVIVSIYYTFVLPRDGVYSRRRIWEQNNLVPTGFSLNYIIGSIYWLVLFILQLGYIGHLFSGKVEHVNAATAVGSHFILNNLFHFAFVMLFVRSFFGWAELILILNLFNLSSLYFRHSGYPRFIHTPAVSGPLAWTFVAILWNGAIMVPHPNTYVARIFANIFIWAILLDGAFFLVAYGDYTLGFAFSVLSAALGVAQFQAKVIALQWIFAFVIMAVLFVASLIVAIPTWLGKEVSLGRRQVVSDQERAPLLGENN